MKKLILGIAMFIGGILGFIGVIIAAALGGGGFHGQLFDSLAQQGTTVFFFIFSLLSIIGLSIAFDGAFDRR